MRNHVSALAPPAIFALAATMAWLSKPAVSDRSVDESFLLQSPRRRSVAKLKSGTMDDVLQRLEKKILPHNPVPPRKLYDAKTLNRMLVSRSDTEFCFGGGSDGLDYAREWAEDSPEEMFRWLIDPYEKKTPYAQILFSKWAEFDIESALAAVFKIPDTRLRAQALLSTLEAVCKSNPERAKDLLVQNISLYSSDKNDCSFGDNDNTDSAWNMLLALPPGNERTQLQAKRLLDANIYDDDYIKRIWNNASESQRSDWFAAGFQPINHVPDGLEGLFDMLRKKAEDSNNLEQCENFIFFYGDTFAKQDLATAIDWTQNHLRGQHRIESMEKLLNAGIKNDFETTLRIWQNLPDGYQKKLIALHLLWTIPDERKSEAKAILYQP